jgi:hypothetical protein
MIRLPEIWDIMVMKMPQNEWVSLQDIYAIVKRNHQLDDEDYLPQAPRSDLPKWQRNVRNVLQRRKSIGHIEWNGYAQYRLR